VFGDAAVPVYEHFAQTTLNRPHGPTIKQLIDIHRDAPFGPHPDALARVLNIFRSQETVGKYLIMALPGEAGYRLAKITGDREKGSVTLETNAYQTIGDAEHAVFVIRVHEFGRGAGPEETT
jgi:hypothetical protein